MSRSKLVIGLIVSLAISFAAAALGGIASVNAGDFYESLRKPSWAPSPSVFGPVWTILYALMGVAAWLVWKKSGFQRARTALTLYIVQLLTNALWTWIFFAWREGGAAFAEILVLWVMVLATLLLFWRETRVAGALLLPYLGWVTFATGLTFAVWRMNPPVLS